MTTKVVLCLFFLATSFVFALETTISPKAGFETAIGEVVGTQCQNKLKNISELRLLFSVSSFRNWLFSPSPAPDYFLEDWSGDFLAKSILSVDQSFGATCAMPPKTAAAYYLLQRSFLHKLSPELGFLPRAEIGDVVRVVISRSDDGPQVKKSLASFKIPAERIAEKLAVFLYEGSVKKIRGVWSVSKLPAPLAKLETFLSEICPSTEDCIFWSGSFIYRVMVVEQDGVAAYVPNFALLILSKQLLAESTTSLHKIILLHELSHAAELRALKVEGVDWKSEFGIFSGWAIDKFGKWTAEVRKVKGRRQDALTEESKNDAAFSILPDDIYLGNKAKFDGFVMGKTFDATASRRELSEDLADHIAVFRFFPERYCFGKIQVAPHKFRWVASHLFKEAPPITCM